MFNDLDINKIQGFSMVSSVEKFINILLVTKIMITKIKHYAECCQKQALF